MIGQEQLFFKDDKNIGDCFRTCIACILEVPPESLPHYTDEKWLAKWQKYLKRYGLALRIGGIDASYRGYTIAGVPSLNYGRKVEHAVVAWRGSLAYDPTPGKKRQRIRKVSNHLYFEAIDPSKISRLSELR